MTCKCCKRAPKEEAPQDPASETKSEEEEPKKATGCFSCKKKKTGEEAEERENLAESEATAKKSCWERLKCCKKGESGEGCCSKLKRKKKWAKRMDSILSEPAPKP